jgi:site-specific DNA recombinase
MKAIGYVRVSTEEQAREGISLDNQKDRIKSYCQYKSLELLQIIEDAGISGGKNKARPGFVELLDRIESNHIEAVVLYSLERLSRDMLTLLALERLLDEKVIELHTVEGQVDTGSPDGWLNFAMKAFLGEMERRQVKYRTKKAMEYKKGQGSVVGSVPFGYRREGNDLVVDLHEQSVVRLINTLYSQSMRLIDISKILKRQGMKTRNGKDFTAEQVRRIVTGYEGKFTKSNTTLSRNIRGFVEAIA